jgi:hypothetical protein
MPDRCADAIPPAPAHRPAAIEGCANVLPVPHNRGSHLLEHGKVGQVAAHAAHEWLVQAWKSDPSSGKWR